MFKKLPQGDHQILKSYRRLCYMYILDENRYMPKASQCKQLTNCTKSFIRQDFISKCNLEKIHPYVLYKYWDI